MRSDADPAETDEHTAPAHSYTAPNQDACSANGDLRTADGHTGSTDEYTRAYGHAGSANEYTDSDGDSGSADANGYAPTDGNADNDADPAHGHTDVGSANRDPSTANGDSGSADANAKGLAGSNSNANPAGTFANDHTAATVKASQYRRTADMVADDRAAVDSILHLSLVAPKLWVRKNLPWALSFLPAII